MWKKLSRYLPTRENLRQQMRLNWLLKHLQHPQFWRFECHAVAKGTAFGLLAAFIPLPGQTLFSALLAYVGRANVAIAIGLTWITNPLTFVPINYGIYKVGQWLTRDISAYHPFTEFDWQKANFAQLLNHLGQWLSSLGKPFLIGSVAVAISSAIMGYLLVQALWHVAKWWRRIKQTRRQRNA